MIHFEDLNVNYISIFYRHNNKIYSIEFSVETYVNPTLDVKGDGRIQGDLIVYNKYDSQQYVTIDPINKYMGVNTDDRFIYYNIDYATVNKQGEQLAYHHMYVTNDTYPNLVCERINDSSGADTSSYSSFSAATMKRHSNIDTFDQMVSKTIQANITDYGVGKNTYGVDIAFEISDKSKTTHEIGNILMGIDSIVTTSNGNRLVKAGFGVRVNDEFLKHRQILYVDNTGCLSIDSIKIKNTLMKVENELLILPTTLEPTRTSFNNKTTIKTQFPFSLENKTSSLQPFKTYNIPLPVLSVGDIISIQISMEYTEYVANDLTTNNTYFFKTNFTYIQTVSNRTIHNMPFIPKLYSCNNTTTASNLGFRLTYSTNNIINIEITLPINTYMVSTCTITFNEITFGSATLTAIANGVFNSVFDNFIFTIGGL
jgi:hypothetical protein